MGLPFPSAAKHPQYPGSGTFYRFSTAVDNLIPDLSGTNLHFTFKLLLVAAWAISE